MASEATSKPTRPRSRSRSGSRSPLSRIRSKSNIKVETAAVEKSPKSRGFFGFGSGKAASPRADSTVAEATKEAPQSAAAAAAASSSAGGGSTSPSSPTSPPASPRSTPLGRTASFIKSAGRGSPKAKAVPVVDTAAAYRKDRLPRTLSALLVTALAAVAVALFYGHGDGPRLAKRDAPLYDGDALSGGEYINTCTGALSFGCAPKYFELTVDGELGLYEGAAPPAASGGSGFLGLGGLLAGSGGSGEAAATAAPAPVRIWSSGTRARGGKAKDASHLAEYKDGTLSLLRDGKVVWKSPVSRLPKDLQPWPLHA